MKTKKRQKLCYNCEGEVDLDVIVCPFCAADLRVERPENKQPAYNPALSSKNYSTQQSLYPPHYAPSSSQEEIEEETLSEPPEEVTYEEKNLLGPILLLTLGSQLFLLSIFMLLFSKNGVLTCQWDARLWFFYFLGSIPFCIFGYRALIKDS